MEDTTKRFLHLMQKINRRTRNENRILNKLSKCNRFDEDFIRCQVCMSASVGVKLDIPLSNNQECLQFRNLQSAFMDVYPRLGPP